jgi:hypothetical protein
MISLTTDIDVGYKNSPVYPHNLKPLKLGSWFYDVYLNFNFYLLYIGISKVQLIYRAS